MELYNTYTLINEQTGNLAFRLLPFADNHGFDRIQRLCYYSLVWIREGEGTALVDFTEYPFSANTLLATSPYQPFMFEPSEKIKGVVLNFHPDFFCIHKHHKQVACNGVLFNTIYSPPLFPVDEATANSFGVVLEQMKVEVQNPELAQYDLLISYLKIFLITAVRHKQNLQAEPEAPESQSSGPYIIQKLRNLIEAHYKSIHSPKEYADLLHMTPNALGKLAKSHYKKTLSNLISERIIIEAKRELYLTDKPVKEIAYDLGYEDAYYFSRFFKNHADVSPKRYRETVGSARAMA